MIFTYQQIAQLNDTETSIYQYIINHMESVLKMSVRDLANETYVSTATIVRFCQKMGCDGFVDFKAQLKLFHEGSTPPVVDDEIDVLLDFLIIQKEKLLKKYSKIC